MGRLHGAMTAMITPFDEAGDLKLDLLPAYLEFQRAAGIGGVVVSGTNGEGVSMTVDERKRLLEGVLRHKGNLTVIAGTGAAALPDAMELTRHAASAGADAVLVLPPFFFKNPTAQGVADYFRRVMDISDIPVLLYSIPQQSAVAVTDEILSLLDGHERLAGLKDSAGDWERTHALVTGRRDLAVLSGSDDLLDRAIGAGAVGNISGTANAFPELIVGVWRASQEGNVEEAKRQLDAAKGILMQYPLIAASKSVLAYRRVGRMFVRPPLINLTRAQEEEMLGRLKEAHLLS
jgi:4-hydroxy-tetrahydrodipicolinate synthase